MKKYFLDCGTNLGQGLLQFIDRNIIDESFEVHLFEPNPHAIDFVKNRLSDEKYKKYNIIFHTEALWIEDCEKTLTVESFDGEYICQHTGEHLGYDLNAGGATNIMEDEWMKPHYIKDKDLNKDLKVNCIDFSEFLSNNIEDGSYVICKMDIEGAEYDVLGKMIDDDTINKIDEIYIEWHNHLLKSNYDTNAFIQEMKKRNIKVESWI
jgi:FkbM family methyltransferase